MRRLALTLAAVLVLAGVAVAPAAAQDQASDDGNESESETTALAAQLGALNVHSYNYDGERMNITVTWTGETGTRVTLTEMLSLDSAGSAEISFKRVRLLPGRETQLTVAVEERPSGAAAVLVTTPESIERGDALVLQSGSPSTNEPVPFNLALGLAVLSAGGGAGAVFGYVRRKRDSDDDDWHERKA